MQLECRSFPVQFHITIFVKILNTISLRIMPKGLRITKTICVDPNTKLGMQLA